MSTHMIPRKEVGHSPVPVKPETATSTWDVPVDQPKKKYTPFAFGASATGWTLSDRFDRVLPPHRRYCGRSRRTLLLAVLALLLCLLALVIGLAVGLTRKSGPQNLPLPSNAQTWTGDLTYYAPGLGACGLDSNDRGAVVAVSHYTFDAAQTGSDPNQNPLCGRKIRAQRVDERTGKQVSIDVTVVDRCTGCAPTDIDVSPAMFDRMADHDLGRVKVTWAWL